MDPCLCTIEAIAAFCGGVNAPGLDRQLSITCEDQILAIPAPDADTHLIDGNITYRAAAVGPPAVTAGKFYKWGFAKDGASYSSERDENGLWNTEVKIFIQKLEESKTHTLNGLTGDNLICIVPDRNGNARLIGNKTNGATVKVKETTDPKNGYEVSIMWQSAYAPYFYTGTITY
jgi:hypothetical protein